VTEPQEPTLRKFSAADGLPAFIERIDDFPHTKILYLKGALDNDAAIQMDHFFKKAQKSPAHLDKNVLLDFRKVAHMESGAIAQLIKALMVLKKKGHHFGLLNVSDKMRGTLEILKLDTAFRIFDSKSEALEEVVKWSEEW
jgi:anti-anti-sigma factor